MAILVGLAFAAVSLALFAALVATPAAPGLGPAARAGLGETGVSNPVTAVLLDYRGYDTLLELLVVAIAAVAAGALAPRRAEPRPIRGPVAETTAALLAPAIVTTAGYVLWIGAKAPGGAFQAASLLAGALILLDVTGKGAPPHGPAASRALAGLGVLAFVAVGVAVAPATGAFLDYPAPIAGDLILAVEAAATVGVAIGLRALFRAGTAAA